MGWVLKKGGWRELFVGWVMGGGMEGVVCGLGNGEGGMEGVVSLNGTIK